MKVEPKKSDMKIHRQIIKKSDYDNNIKKSRNVGIKIGGIIICRLILNIIKQNISDNEKVIKIKEFELVRKQLEQVEKRLEDEKFISKAPQKIIDGAKKNAEILREKYAKIDQSIKKLR